MSVLLDFVSQPIVPITLLSITPMLLKYFIKNKKVANTLFATAFLPYLLICLTMGGAHGSFFSNSNSHCDHTRQSISHKTGDAHIENTATVYRHDSETCQICQWLKTPSYSVKIPMLNSHLEGVYFRSFSYANLVLPSLSINKFTIRPPPVLTCFSV